MYLMLKDYPVMQFEIDGYIDIIDNSKLPYSLKDYIHSTADVPFKVALNDLIAVKEYLLSRTFSSNRDQLKPLLEAAGLSVSCDNENKLEIVLLSRALSMTDSYWLKYDTENIKFEEVNLRKNKLSDIMFDISILGKKIMLPFNLILPDLSTSGMFRKTWCKNNDEIILRKSDRTPDYKHVKAEVKASEILDTTNISHVKYNLYSRDGILASECLCLSNDNISLISAKEIKLWCEHIGQDFIEFLELNYLEDFSKMCVIDYILANTDRRLNNWSFLIDNNTNNIIGIAPLYGYNQALIADDFYTNVDGLIYEVTGLSMFESAKKYFETSHLKISGTLPTKCLERLRKLMN